MCKLCQQCRAEEDEKNKSGRRDSLMFNIASGVVGKG